MGGIDHQRADNDELGRSGGAQGILRGHDSIGVAESSVDAADVMAANVGAGRKKFPYPAAKKFGCSTYRRG